MALSQLITTIDGTKVGINNTASANATNAVVLGNGQNLGIGNNEPLAGLHIGNTGATIPAIYLKDSTAETLPTVASGDGVFSVLAGVPTFTDLSSSKTISVVSSEEINSGTLTAGTVTVNSSIVTSTSGIFLTRTTTTGDVTTVGTISVGTIIDNISFAVNSTVLTDVGNFNYFIVNQ